MYESIDVLYYKQKILCVKIVEHVGLSLIEKAAKYVHCTTVDMYDVNSHSVYHRYREVL